MEALIVIWTTITFVESRLLSLLLLCECPGVTNLGSTGKAETGLSILGTIQHWRPRWDGVWWLDGHGVV